MPKLRGQKLAAYFKRREVWAGTGVIAAALVISFMAGRDHPPVVEDSLETLRFGELEPLPAVQPVAIAKPAKPAATPAPSAQPMTGWVVANEPVSLDWAPPVAPAPRIDSSAAAAVEANPAEQIENVASSNRDVVPTGAEADTADPVGRAVVPLPPQDEPEIEVVDERPMVRPARLSGQIDHVEPFVRRTSLRNDGTSGNATR